MRRAACGVRGRGALVLAACLVRGGGGRAGLLVPDCRWSSTSDRLPVLQSSRLFPQPSASRIPLFSTRLTVSWSLPSFLSQSAILSVLPSVRRCPVHAAKAPVP